MLHLLSTDQMACNGIAFTSPFSSHNFLQQIQISDETEYQQEFQGVDIGTMLGKKSMFKPCEDDLSSDELTQAGDKKRRLSIEQVRTLEKSFEIGNKLEPERKMQLARALGLLPRQVAIWFQNRRARWKNKKLEKDYDVVKRQIEAVRLENEALQAQNKRLQAEIWAIKGRETSQLINLNKEIEGSYSNRSEDSSEINLDISKTPTIESPLNPHQSISFFPTIRPPTMIQLFEESNRPELSCPKIQHNLNFNNLICGIDDQSQFWPWSDHHNLQ